MNTRIFSLIDENLKNSFNLPKYDNINEQITENTHVGSLPWSPARLRKFKDSITSKLQLDISSVDVTVKELVADLDKKYMHRFFGEIWQPTTEKYQYSGWSLVDLINNTNPKAVLDFGCGYHPFKSRINNLIGIDPFNNSADYMVDILDFAVEPESYDHIIVFGSLNFGDRGDIETRFAKLESILMPGGRMYFRANPGHLWPKGPYVDIFPWSFEVAYELAKKHNLELEKFKQDNGDRLYFEFHKPQ